jgi:hypothetical protein
MSHLLDRLLKSIDFQPSIPGLVVTEPETVLEVNLAWSEWDGAVKAMDECGAYAVAHPEICR